MAEDKVMVYSRGELVDHMVRTSHAIYITKGLDAALKYQERAMEELVVDYIDVLNIKEFFGVDLRTAEMLHLMAQYGCPSEKLDDIWKDW